MRLNIGGGGGFKAAHKSLLHRSLLLLTTTVMADVCVTNFYWREEVDSTMDEARRLLKEEQAERPFAVAAGRQTVGRGTRGRTWSDGDGNVKVTVALAVSSLPLSPLTLLPLRVGVLARSVLAPYLRDPTTLTLKWPNDILLESNKLAGTLIEMEGDSLLIGIGVNLKVAPNVRREGPDAGRSSAALTDANSTALPDAETLSRQIATAIADWATNTDADATVVSDWTKLADWQSTLTLRDATQQQVEPLRLLDDGRLLVKPVDGGPERTLVAEYLL